MSIDDAMAARFPWATSVGERLRERSVSICNEFCRAGLLDHAAGTRLCSEDDSIFWPTFSEVIVGDLLRRAGLDPSHREPGPDFLLEHAGTRIWVEVITPAPNGLPEEWLNPKLHEAYHVPATSILLRWTAAIKEKAEKLLGRNAALPQSGYLERGIVGRQDAYVIAVNGLRLRNGGFPQLEGLSQFPFAVEATYAVGPLATTIDRDTLEYLGTQHLHQPEVQRAERASVPADTFHDPHYAPISAVWALDAGPMSLLGEVQPMVVVHNPHATNPLPVGLLPAQSEYKLEMSEVDFSVRRMNGRDHRD